MPSAAVEPALRGSSVPSPCRGSPHLRGAVGCTVPARGEPRRLRRTPRTRPGALVTACPQPCGRVDTAEALIRRGSRRRPDGDRRRQIEELSPGMCTGWGDLVCARSQEVTVPTVRTGPHGAVAGEPADDGPLTCTSAATYASVRPRRGGRRFRRTWVRPGDGPRETRGQKVDGRRRRCTTVEMSTCRQQGDADRPQSANRAIRALTCTKGPIPRIHTCDDEDEGVISRNSRTTLWVGTLRPEASELSPKGIAAGTRGGERIEVRGFPRGQQQAR